ncbi:MAG TPA: hypothetical protein VG734_13865 [Lacunisphaera sp.]|nr:hypothetical protein [Lacunisphaera sp.]
MITRALLTRLLLVWSLGLGLLQAGARPAYEFRPERVPACADCDKGCEGMEQMPAKDCQAVCLVWCVTPGFNALAEAEAHPVLLTAPGPAPRWVDFHGPTRSARPLLPPPRV